MLLAGCGVLWAPTTALGATGGLGPRTLRRALTKDLSEVDGVHGAYVVDLTAKQPLFHFEASTARMPASVEKLYTTSTALLRLGRSAVFTTSVLGTDCRGKTGTLSEVANLVGYCTARDGHRLAFAFLMNRLSNPDTGHAIEAKMAVALANYKG